MYFWRCHCTYHNQIPMFNSNHHVLKWWNHFVESQQMWMQVFGLPVALCLCKSESPFLAGCNMTNLTEVCRWNLFQSPKVSHITYAHSHLRGIDFCPFDWSMSHIWPCWPRFRNFRAQDPDEIQPFSSIFQPCVVVLVPHLQCRFRHPKISEANEWDWDAMLVRCEAYRFKGLCWVEESKIWSDRTNQPQTCLVDGWLGFQVWPLLPANMGSTQPTQWEDSTSFKNERWGSHHVPILAQEERTSCPWLGGSIVLL
jgi:hypothetical protein